MKDQIFEVSINQKVVNLSGKYIGNRFCVDSSSIDAHPSLIHKEKESLKARFRNDKSLLII